MDRMSQRTTLSIIFAALLHASGIYAQSGDGGTADGYGNSNLGAAGTGGQGSASSSANLSKGAIIAIAVVVIVVVIGATILSVLFFIAKKRQWEVRKSIRRTASKAVKAMTPRTPARMSFSPRSPRSPNAATRAFTRRPPPMKQNKKAQQDLEKGFASIDQTIQRSSEESHASSKLDNNPTRPLNVKKDSLGATRQKPKAILTVPPSDFDADSPKSPIWNRVFGRV